MAWFLPMLGKIGGALKTVGKVGSTVLAGTGGTTGTVGKIGQAAFGMGEGGGFLSRLGSLLNTRMGTDYATEGTAGLGQLLSGIGLYAQNQGDFGADEGRQRLINILSQINQMYQAHQKPK